MRPDWRCWARSDGGGRTRWASRRTGRRVGGARGPGAAIVAGDAAGHRDVGRPRQPGRRCRECHRGAGSARHPRAGQRRRRRQPPDLPPGEGARVGRGLPADARGGLAADPPGARRRRCPRRGAPPALCRHHARPGAPCAVVGGAPRDARPRGAPPAEPVPAGRARTRARARPRRPAGPPRTPDEAGRRRRPGVRRPPRVAHGCGSRRGHAPVRDRPRRDPRGHRRGPTGVAQRPSSGERDGPGQAREVRRRDPRRPRDGPGDARRPPSERARTGSASNLRAVRMDRPYAGRTHREIT